MPVWNSSPSAELLFRNTWPSPPGVLAQQFAHATGGSRAAGSGCGAAGIHQQAQRVLVLVEGGGLVRGPGCRPDDQHGHMAPAMRSVGSSGLIKDDHQQPVFLENGAGEQRAHIVLQPLVGGGELQAVGTGLSAVGAIVRVI